MLLSNWTGVNIVFACGHAEPLAAHPDIAAILRPPEGLEVYARRLHMPEGVDCSQCGPNTLEYWAMVCRMIQANAGRDFPITLRPSHDV